MACYEISFRQRVASVVGEAADLMKKEGLYEVDDEKLTENAVNGMLQEIDRFSDFMVGKEAKSHSEILKQKYQGLGINIRQLPETGNILVLRPFWGSPAMDAGIRPGDVITEVDGVSFHKDQEMDEVFEKLRGPDGSKVELTIERKDSSKPDRKQALKLTVTRGSIKTDSVFGYQPDGKGGWLYLVPKKYIQHSTQETRSETDELSGIAYIRIDKFGNRTVDELTEALNSVKENMTGLVIDLRGNPGGFLDSAIAVSDMFLPENRLPIVSQRNRHGDNIATAYTNKPSIISDSIPMVILINGDSASASEIVSACLQDHGRAKIVGQRSFGKGTVQSYFSLSLPGSVLKLTTATYWRPSGKNIHKMRYKDPEKQKEFEEKQKGLGQNDQWGVRPDPGYEIPISQIDNYELSTMRFNTEMGLDVDSLTDAHKEFLKGLRGRVEQLGKEESRGGLEDWEFKDQIHWKDGKHLIQRDIQLQKALQTLYED